MTEQDLFLAVLDLPDPAARARYLDAACAGDPARRARIEALLASHAAAGSFLGRPAVERPSDTCPTLDEEADDAADGTAAALALLAPSNRADSLGRLEHYEILEVLGRGAFGIVFRAFDEVLQRGVAVKMLDPRLAVTSPARKRFLREARAAARVRHPNVVQVHAVHEKPLPFLVMEHVPGETLQQRLDRTGPLETEEVVHIGRQVAWALEAAHQTGLIHRDIKPGNILLEPGPQPHVKVTDFGLARTTDDASSTQSGIVAGTPMFMAPEQARGESLDSRADLFSLGSVLYTIVSGHPPFRASGTLAVLKRVLEDDPRPIPEVIPEAPSWLCAVITKLHAKDRNQRFASAREVAELLALGPAGPASWDGEQPRPAGDQAAPGRRSRRGLAVALVLLGLLAVLGLTEATDVTHLRDALLHLSGPEGTLVLVGDDPSVRVTLDGRQVALDGTGTWETRLKAGDHVLEISKDGRLRRREVVTLAANGRRVVRLAGNAHLAPEVVAWEKSVAALPAEELAEAVIGRLKSLNPTCTDTFTPTLDQDRVVRLDLTGNGPGLRDISPLRALPDLQELALRIPNPKLSDISPLRGLALTELVVHHAATADLSPLRGMRLSHLDCSGWPRLADLTPLRGMPLNMLSVPSTAVQDLAPLAGMPLTWLNCDATSVADLAPLEGMPLTELHLRETRVSDLKWLRGMPLVSLDYTNTPVTDVSPLAGLPLRDVRCSFQAARDAAVLRSIPTLETINGIPVAEFWKGLGSREGP